MIPWRYNQVIMSFVLSLGAVNLATEACLRARVPWWASVPLLAFAGLGTFAVALLTFGRVNVQRNRARMAAARRLRRAAQGFYGQVQVGRAV